MHDLEFEHLHVDASEGPLNEVAWAADNVELTTVGIDIGSSTSHLMFARVHLQRLGTALSSRFVVVGRKLLWQSPILLTPYLPDYTIDVEELAGFIGGAYAYAGIEREAIDSGAVILTGEAIKRKNARAIADLFSEEAGKFVCASAGHHMECQMSAHGSGAVALSRGHGVTLAQRRYRRRHHQADADRQRAYPRHGGDRGRRPADRRGRERPHPDRTAGAGGGASARHRARRSDSRSRRRTRRASSSAWRGSSWA